jgi:hypothetical protein
LKEDAAHKEIIRGTLSQIDTFGEAECVVEYVGGREYVERRLIERLLDQLEHRRRQSPSDHLP